MRRIPSGWLAVLVVAAGSAAAAEDEAQVAARFPHAGIEVVLPAGFRLGTPEQAFGVLHAVPGGAGAPNLSVRVTALPVGADADPASVADEIVSALRQDLDFRDVERRKAVTATIAGRSGNIGLLSYTCSGRDCTAATATFLRETASGGRLCYVLSVEASREDQRHLLPMLSGLLKSVKLIEFACPASLKLGELGDPLADPKLGYSIRVPAGWCVRRRYGGIVFGQSDYRGADGLGFDARVVVEPAAAGATAKGLLEKRTADAAKQGRKTFDVLSSGEAKLGGLPGWQAVMLPASAATQAAEEQEQPGLRIVHRTAVASPPAGDGQARSAGSGQVAYSLVLVSMGATAERAQAVMDMLASGFTLIPRTPTTRPTE